MKTRLPQFLAVLVLVLCVGSSSGQSKDGVAKGKVGAKASSLPIEIYVVQPYAEFNQQWVPAFAVGYYAFSLRFLEGVRQVETKDLSKGAVARKDAVTERDVELARGYLAKHAEVAAALARNTKEAKVILQEPQAELSNISGCMLIKVSFASDTNPTLALKEVIGYVSRARSFMPPNTHAPYVFRIVSFRIRMLDVAFPIPNGKVVESNTKGNAK